MSVKRYLVFRKSDGIVVNLIAYDGTSDFILDEELGMELVPAGSYAGVGWLRRNNGEYLEPALIEDASE